MSLRAEFGGSCFLQSSFPLLRSEPQPERKPPDSLQASELANVAGDAQEQGGEHLEPYQGLLWGWELPGGEPRA